MTTTDTFTALTTRSLFPKISGPATAHAVGQFGMAVRTILAARSVDPQKALAKASREAQARRAVDNLLR